MKRGEQGKAPTVSAVKWEVVNDVYRVVMQGGVAILLRLRCRGCQRYHRDASIKEGEHCCQLALMGRRNE